MVSPEILRRYSFFGAFNEAQLRAIAMIADEVHVPSGTILFEEGNPADRLYLLLEGSVDLSYKSEEEYHPKTKKVFQIGEINPEEVFGISAVLEPFTYIAAARVSQDSRILSVNAIEFRELMKNDLSMGFALMHQVAKAAMERLTHTRVQLAAAWAQWGK